MPSGDVGRPSWHKPALVFAMLLVVGQVVAFLVLRAAKKSEKKIDGGSDAVATIAIDAAALEPAPVPPPTVDAAAEVIIPVDAAVEVPAKVTTTTTTPKT